MRFVRTLLVAPLIAVGMSMPASAQGAGVTLEVRADPDVVVPVGADVTFHVLMLLPAEEAATITVLESDRYGNVADAGNAAILDTTCTTPSTPEAGDIYGAYDWGCTYRVRIEGQPGELTDTVSATVILADDTEVATSAAVSLAISAAVGAIRGTITDDVTGAPISGVAVAATGPEGDEVVLTDEFGRYSMDQLEPGEYRLRSGNAAAYYSDYAAEWWDDAADIASAGTVVVIAGEVTTVDWALALGGVITGTVTDEMTGRPLPGVHIGVSVLRPDDSGGSWSGAGRTDESGVYRIAGLSAADHRVCFWVNGYEGMCWNGQPTFGHGLPSGPGDPIAAAPGSVVTGIDAALAPISPPTTVTTTTIAAVQAQPTVPDGGDALPATGPSSAVGWALLIGLAALVAGQVARRSSVRPSSR